MKIIQLVWILVVVFSVELFAQGKVAKILHEKWDVEIEKWTFVAEDNWTYKQTGQEISFTHRDNLISDYVPHNNVDRYSFYDTGRLIQQKTKRWGITGWQEEVIDYQYSTGFRLEESLTRHTSSATTETQFIKFVHELEEAENRRSTIQFSALNQPDNWLLNHRRDSFFNEQGCLSKQSITNYSENEEEITERFTLATYTLRRSGELKM